MKQSFKRILAVLLALVLLVGILPTSVPAANSVKEGIYLFQISLGSNKVMEIAGSSKRNNGNVHLNDRTGAASQIFKVQKEGAYYSISNVNSGKFVTVDGGSKADMANIKQYAWTGAKSQLWKFIAAGNNAYYITNVGSGLAISIAGGKAISDTEIWQYTLYKKNSQKWKMIPVKRVTSVSLDKENIVLKEGKKVALKEIVKPSGATTKTVSWKSSDKMVARVSAKGVVTAVSAGKAKITATTTDGNKKASCIVTVKAMPKPTATPKPTKTPTAAPKPTKAPTVAPKAPTVAPTPGPSSGNYVLNIKTKVFHRNGCSAAKRMNAENRAYSNESRAALISQGYSPCGTCHS